MSPRFHVPYQLRRGTHTSCPAHILGYVSTIRLAQQAASLWSAGACSRQEGLPGRRLVEPGRSAHGLARACSSHPREPLVILNRVSRVSAVARRRGVSSKGSFSHTGVTFHTPAS
jgi:hypothetical protein